MANEVKLTVTVQELDFIATVLGALPTAQTMQHGMLHLIPKLQVQANLLQAASGAEVKEP